MDGENVTKQLVEEKDDAVAMLTVVVYDEGVAVEYAYDAVDVIAAVSSVA